ncbi:monovalent cation/H(+) antiporter subunit G [Planctomycetota bacterium]
MRLMTGAILIGLGVFLWFWGAWHLAGKKSYLWKIHALGIADMIGSLFILAGLLVRSLEYWPHLLLAMGSIGFWGTALSFILARMGTNFPFGEQETQQETREGDK